MRLIAILFLTFIFSRAYCQNEFAATAFYSEFRKVWADAQNGFSTYKGEKRISEFEEFRNEFKINYLLPLSDSGKIVYPTSGNPYAIFYFEPDKVRLKVDQRGANLRDAIVTAYGLPLYARTETVFINNNPYSNTYYYTDPNETSNAMAIFRMTIYYKEGKYFLSLEINGKRKL